LFHCMQVSLAEGGPGLGLCWGRETATRMLAEAGFGAIEIVPTPAGDPVNAIFTARPNRHSGDRSSARRAPDRE